MVDEKKGVNVEEVDQEYNEVPQPSNVESSSDNNIYQEFKTTAVERMSADQIYNTLVNNDHKGMASLFFALFSRMSISKKKGWLIASIESYLDYPL